MTFERDYDTAELLKAIGGPIFDYSLTTPNPEMLQYYHPYPAHLQNYNRIYAKATGRSEVDDFEGKPIADFMDFCTACGIDKVSVKSRDLETTWNFRIPNELIADLQNEFGERVIGFAGIDPYKGMTGVRDLEFAVKELGLKGLNLQLYELKMQADDKKLYPLYAKCCELDIPVNLHTSINFTDKSPMRCGHPAAVDEVALDFPELRIICGPPGWPWVNELIGVAWRHPNVYIAIESVRPALLAKANSGYEALFTYGNSVLQDKMIFGSGWPLLPMRQGIAEMASLPWKPEVLPKLFRENGLRACGLA